jgi:hypothetical protein
MRTVSGYRVPMEINPIEVQTHLKGIDYPASKDEVVATAESNGAPQEIVEALQRMDGTEFEGPDDVMAALG